MALERLLPGVAHGRMVCTCPGGGVDDRWKRPPDGPLPERPGAVLAVAQEPPIDARGLGILEFLDQRLEQLLAPVIPDQLAAEVTGSDDRRART